MGPNQECGWSTAWEWTRHQGRRAQGQAWRACGHREDPGLSSGEMESLEGLGKKQEASRKEPCSSRHADLRAGCAGEVH